MEETMTRRTALLLFVLSFAAGLGAAHACSKDQIIKWTDERNCTKTDGTTGTKSRICLTKFCPKDRSEQVKCMDWGSCS
jgi:hypothetical protein